MIAAQELANSTLTNDELMEQAKHLREMADKWQKGFMHRSMHAVRWEKQSGLYAQALMIRRLAAQGYYLDSK